MRWRSFIDRMETLLLEFDLVRAGVQSAASGTESQGACDKTVAHAGYRPYDRLCDPNGVTSWQRRSACNSDPARAVEVSCAVARPSTKRAPIMVVKETAVLLVLSIYRVA